jgi:hypothetical protein
LARFTYNLDEVEIEILGLLAERKERDRLFEHGTACDRGMIQREIDAAYSRFGVAARRRALDSLVGKGEIVRDQAGPKGKPYRITEMGEARLDEYARRLRESISDGSASASPPLRPDDDDPRAMGWLARLYAEAMFPPPSGKKGRGK